MPENGQIPTQDGATHHRVGSLAAEDTGGLSLFTGQFTSNSKEVKTYGSNKKVQKLPIRNRR